MKLYVAERNPERCRECGFCKSYACPSSECIGCGACHIACPNEAVRMVEKPRSRHVTIKVNGETFTVPERITVKQALEGLGYKSARFPGEGDFFAPCEVGGCWSCALEVDGVPMPSCVTPVKGGMEISTRLPDGYVSKRVVHGFSGHAVGGVGTPWWLKGGYGYVEAACFACGCNFRCPQCQNWTTTYCGKEPALTPKAAAQAMTATRRRTGVNRMAISGGESTLNRKWLIRYVEELRKLNPGEENRIHIDTNASILTRDYVDELVEAGMTDIGPDLKSLHKDTFMKITGLVDGELAERYLRTAWEAAKYLIDNYKHRVFVGVGVVYNRDLISIREIGEIGDRIRSIDPEVQVCVLDYRPEFRRMGISRPSYWEMVRVQKTLKETGLKTVVCQTERGHIAP